MTPPLASAGPSLSATLIERQDAYNSGLKDVDNQAKPHANLLRVGTAALWLYLASFDGRNLATAVDGCV